MANKVNTAIAAIKAALEATTTFKHVTTRLINPLLETHRVPMANIEAGDCRHVGPPRSQRQWTVQYVIQVVTVCKASSCELELIDLIAAVEGVIDALGSVGCVVNQPQWIIQKTLRETTVAAWAIGTGELQITGPLLSS